MNVFITGGTGFIGTQISKHLLNKGYYVIAVGLSPTQNRINHQNFRYISADTTKEGIWQNDIPNSDIIINLTGASIFNRWNEKYKKLIYDTRILTTRNIVNAIDGSKRVLLYSTSAVGYYGFRGDEELTEESTSGDDFLANVCKDWEYEANKAKNKNARVVITRFGIVLGRNGGTLGIMIPLFKLFLGGKLGSGQQWFSWIHSDDLINAFMFILGNENIEGAVNFCSPNPVRNYELTKALGKVMHRPTFIPAPAFAVRLFLGEFADNILKGQKAIPSKLIKNGYNFKYPDIIDAIRNIYNK